jgi:hypothetical protein
LPLVTLKPLGSRGPLLLILFVLFVVVLFVIGLVDTCPDGFIRHCVHAWVGYLTGTSCECVPR